MAEYSIMANRIKNLIAEKGINSRALAKGAGISTGQISKYINSESNTFPIHGDSLIRLADYFDVSTDYLLGRADVKRFDLYEPAQIAIDYTGLNSESVEELHYLKEEGDVLFLMAIDKIILH